MLLDALQCAWTATRCAGWRRRRCSGSRAWSPGRPVGGTYYLYRTLRQLDLDGLVSSG